MKKVLALIFVVIACSGFGATSVSQYGFTWAFDADYTVGQYANGDYYVVAPSGLSITDIEPASTFTVLSSSTVTVSEASPAVVTWTAHGLFDNQIVRFTGTPPDPIVAGTLYYVLPTGKTTNTFRISATFGGSAINTTSAGSGTITCEAMRVQHGSMTNPTASNVALQGFDNRLNGASSFRLTLNVARPNNDDLSAGNPLVLAAGTSLVSSRTYDVPQRPQLVDAAVLTIVASAPAAESFRPPYCGTDKTHYWTYSDLILANLQSLAPVAGTPTLSTVAGYFERPWIEIDTEANGRYYHPANNQPDYGYDMTQRISQGVLSLHLNYTEEEKKTLLVRMVQYGLDIYGAAVSGGVWSANGGQNMGRKAPMTLAGILFNDVGILEYADAAQHFIFQEDRQTFVVDEAQEALTPYMSDGRLRSSYAPKSSAVTISQASPAVVSWTDNGLASMQPITFTTTGSLPEPLVSGQEYLAIAEVMNATDLVAGMYAEIVAAGTTVFTSFGSPNNTVGTFFIATGTPTGTGTVRAVPRNSFTIRATSSGAAINTTTAGSGTHTAQFNLLGVSEFGEKHSSDPQRDGSNWGVLYRNTNYECLMGSALAMHLLTGAVDAWNWTAYFNYMDRAKAVASSGFFSEFVNNMWANYRDGTPDYPFLTSASIATNGTELTLVWSESCTNGAGGGNGVALSSSSGSVSVAYSAGSGSSSYTYTVSPSIKQGAIVTVSYTQPGNGVEATSSGVDVGSFSDQSVTNDSTQQVPAVISNAVKFHLFNSGGF